MKVVMTSTLLSVGPEDLAAFDGLDVDFEAIDGTDRATLLEGTRDADALLVVMEDIDAGVIANLEHCRSITRFGIGYDTIDVPAATAAGIWVTNVPDANYREVAVHAVAMALSLTRRLPAWDRAMRADGWADMAVGTGVRRPDDQVFGLLGLGRIGARVATMAKAIGYRVIAFDPVLDDARAEELGVESVDRDTVIETADVVSLHVPLLESTRRMIDADALARMKPGSVLVNVSRGGLVDEQALADALRSGHLAGAGIDVFEHEPTEQGNPLLGVDTAVLSPHAAHLSAESFAETRRKVFEEAARVLGGGAPRYPVNAPVVPAAS
jgi:D-3-phosphoglycerate dehydrogenase